MIVRELAVLLGYKVDTSGAAQFNASMTGVQGGATAAATSVSTVTTATAAAGQALNQTAASAANTTNALASTTAAANNTASGMTNLQSASQGASAGISGISTALKAVAKSATAAGAAMLLATNSTGDYFGKLDAYSRSLGVSVENLQRLEYAASLDQMGLDQVVSTIGAMNDKLRSTLIYGSDVGKTLNRLGLSAGALRSMKPAEAFEQIATAIKNVSGISNRRFFAEELLGSASPEMMRMIARGGAEIKALGKEAQAMGLIFSRDSVRAFDATSDAIVRLRSLFTSLYRQLAIDLSPTITDIVEKFSRFLTANRKIISENINSTLKTMAGLLEACVKYTGYLYIGLEKVTSAIGGMDNALRLAGITYAIYKIGQLSAYMGALNLSFLTASSGMSIFGMSIAGGPLLAGIAALGLILEDVFLWAADPKAITVMKMLSGIAGGDLMDNANRLFSKDFWTNTVTNGKEAIDELVAYAKSQIQDIGALFGLMSPKQNDLQAKIRATQFQLNGGALPAGAPKPLPVMYVNPAQYTPRPERPARSGDLNINSINVTVPPGSSMETRQAAEDGVWAAITRARQVDLQQTYQQLIGP